MSAIRAPEHLRGLCSKHTEEVRVHFEEAFEGAKAKYSKVSIQEKDIELMTNSVDEDFLSHIAELGYLER